MNPRYCTKPARSRPHALLIASLVSALGIVVVYGQRLQREEEAKEVRGFALGRVMDEIVPGELMVDPPTLENLGLRWYIEGDSNRNASVEVFYRKSGARQWGRALPMLRVHHEVINQDYGPYRAGNLFAGSVMFLDPGSDYEVKLAMQDPDGGAPVPQLRKVKTRAEPRPFENGRKLHVYPLSHKGMRLPDSYDGIRTAYEAAQPGDTLLLHTGIYSIKQTFPLTKSGLPGRPIRFRGGIDGGAIIEGPGYEVDLFDIRAADHLMFENLTLRRARTALLAGTKGGSGASHLTVRRCRFENVIYGINSTSEQSKDWYIADNVLVGTNPTWFPRPQHGYMSPSHTGINVYGRGHIVAYNCISRFSDSLAIANYGPPPDDPRLHPVAIDFYNNDLSYAQDDTIETDYGAHNIRVYRNRCYNTHTGLSAQPLYGGPAYFIRNELYAVTSLAFKLHNYCSGIEAYHNTVATANCGFLSFNRWQNGHFRNNLILGGRNFTRPDGRERLAYAVDTGTISEYSTLDYNGYRRNISGDMIRWYNGRELITYPSLAAFSAATGFERHGVLVDYDIFRRAEAPAPWTTYYPDDYDLRLRDSAAVVDAGILLPNINDAFSGNAPDFGAYEVAQEKPHYGPRPKRLLK